MQHGHTPLHDAEDGDVAKALLDGKADVNAKTKVIRMHNAGRGMHR